MCFTATASFTIGAGLLAGGGACLYHAVKKNLNYLPLAVMPVAVGLQQCAEGVIWHGFESGDLSMVRAFAYLYLFFVWIYWPSWHGFAAAMMEPPGARRKLFYGFAAAGFLLGLSVYVPYALYPEWLNVAVVQNSIAYTSNRMLADGYLPRNLIFAVYLFLISAPMLLSSHRSLRLYGGTLAFFVPVTFFAFIYAYMSVLCFFAAVATAHVLYIIAADKCRDSAALTYGRISSANENQAPV